MSHDDPYDFATLEAGEVIDERRITTLPVDPIAIARSLGIQVIAKPARTEGVSGMFLRVGDAYGIAYATHIDNLGFKNFSVAHELGHYFLPGHSDAVLADSGLHESRAGFASGDRYELEADHFAAGFLMPQKLFSAAMRRSGVGLPAIEKLADLCNTSLTATAIRYTQCTDEPMAIVLSTGKQINYCFMSDALKEFEGLDWIRKRDFLLKNTSTFIFNQDAGRVRRAE
ncbi:MAG: ImmA/IrrE family metallo-endopeptidase, partial [Nitrospira sp.]|nr:ImmA/IrrE family metallo-endopeptidase [Nitrospira sp.]